MIGYPVLRSKPQRWIPELGFGYPPLRIFSGSFWEKLGIFLESLGWSRRLVAQNSHCKLAVTTLAANGSQPFHCRNRRPQKIAIASDFCGHPQNRRKLAATTAASHRSPQRPPDTKSQRQLCTKPRPLK